jgi:hypothetical protein
VNEYSTSLPKLCQKPYIAVVYHLDGSKSYGMHYHNFLHGMGAVKVTNFVKSFTYDEKRQKFKYYKLGQVNCIISTNFVSG